MERYSIRVLVGLLLCGLIAFSSASLAVEGEWTKKADMPTARDSLSTSVVGGKIYAIGGWLSGANVQNAVFTKAVEGIRQRFVRKRDFQFHTTLSIQALAQLVEEPGQAEVCSFQNG